MVFRQSCDHLDEGVRLVGRGRLLGKEVVEEFLLEDFRRTTSWSNQDHLIVLGYGRSRIVQQGRKRAQNEVDLFFVDEAGVVGYSLLLATRVVKDD